MCGGAFWDTDSRVQIISSFMYIWLDFSVQAFFITFDFTFQYSF